MSRKRAITKSDNVSEFPAKKPQPNLKKVEPLTKTQEKVFKAYGTNSHLVLHGFPGTGKTFVPLYLALKDVLEKELYSQILIVRSPTAAKNIGFLPGDDEEKIKVFEPPYIETVNDLMQHPKAYSQLKSVDKIRFVSTAFLRGLNVDDSIILIDEAASATFHELDTVATRVGKNTKLIVCGDRFQSDLKGADKNGFIQFMDVMKRIEGVSLIEFGMEDIVRSGFVKSYIIEKSKCLTQS